jgi:hypothetical protein
VVELAQALEKAGGNLLIWRNLLPEMVFLKTWRAW